MAGESGVVGFEVELEMVEQAVLRRKFRQAAESESYWCLVGSLRFGLDVGIAVETDPFGITDRHVEERGEVVEFALHVGVRAEVQ